MIKDAYELITFAIEAYKSKEFRMAAVALSLAGTAILAEIAPTLAVAFDGFSQFEVWIVCLPFGGFIFTSCMLVAGYAIRAFEKARARERAMAERRLHEFLTGDEEE